MIIRILNTGTNVYINPQVARVVRVFNHRVPNGITEDNFTAKGEILVGLGAGTFAAFPPGSDGQFLKYDSSQASGVIAATPSYAISDATNFLINGGFDFCQRQAPTVLTTIADNAYGPDRWRITRENADVQYQRADSVSVSEITSQYSGYLKKITNAGKVFICQIVEGVNSIPLRNKTVTFQVKLATNTGFTLRIGILELTSSGTIDTMPASMVTSWNANSTDPTLGSNLSVIERARAATGATFQNFYVTATIPSDSKNVICAVWSDSDVAAGDDISIAEAGLFIGAGLQAWTPRLKQIEYDICKRYYEKSYDEDTAPGTAVTGGGVTSGLYLTHPQGPTIGGNRVWQIDPIATKRTTAPTTRFWDDAGNLSKYTAYDVNGGTISSNHAIDAYGGVIANQRKIYFQTVAAAGTHYGMGIMWDISNEL